MSELTKPLLAPLMDAIQQRSTGLFQVLGPVGEVRVHLKKGKVVSIGGLKEMLKGLGAPSESLTGELTADMGVAAAAGVPIDAAMRQAIAVLGADLSRRSAASSARSSFAEAEAPKGAFPVQGDVVRAFAEGLRRQRSADSVRAAFQPVLRHLVVRRGAGGSPPALDPATLRVLRGCNGTRQLTEITGAAAARGPARETATWRGLELLYHLGLVSFAEAPKAAAPPRAAELDADAPEAERKRVKDLRRIAKDLRSMPPLEALGIPTSEPAAGINRERVSTAFRARAQRYHPDRFNGESAAVKDAAAEVFAVINEVHGGLAEPDVLIQVVDRLAAEQRGEVWVSDTDREKSKILYRKAQGYERTRAWGPARELLKQAHELDPTAVDVVMLDTFFGVVLKEFTPKEGIERIQGLSFTTSRGRAEAAFRLGRLNRLIGKDAEAIANFRFCLEKNRGHTGAQRELRLLERRLGSSS